jgi:hypothetical protein
LTAKLHVQNVGKYYWWKGKEMMKRKITETEEIGKIIKKATEGIK